MMKAIVKFINTTILGGILFLAPIVLVMFILGKALTIAHKLLDPMVLRIPFKSIIGLPTPMLLAIFLLVLFCFSAGLLARLAFAKKMVSGLEQSVLSRMPGYALLKSITQSLVGFEERESCAVVLVKFDDSWQIGLRMEGPTDGFATVYVPDAPNPRSGSVHFIAADRIRPAGIPLNVALSCLGQAGAGSGELLRRLSAGATSPKRVSE